MTTKAEWVQFIVNQLISRKDAENFKGWSANDD